MKNIFHWIKSKHQVGTIFSSFPNLAELLQGSYDAYNICINIKSVAFKVVRLLKGLGSLQFETLCQVGGNLRTIPYAEVSYVCYRNPLCEVSAVTKSNGSLHLLS